MIDYYSPNIDLILMGCGFLGGYHMGALCLLRQIWPKKYYERITGASCGGILGSIIVSNVDLLVTFEAAMDVIRVSRKILCGKHPWNSIKNILRDKLEQLLPENCHKLCSSRFGLTLTNPYTFECILVSDFERRQDLIDAVVAGSFIPLWSGSLSLPRFSGKPYVDGGFVNNMPRFEYGQEELESGRRTLGICPFPCNAEISPEKGIPYYFEYHTVNVTYTFNHQALGTLKNGLKALFPFKLSSYKEIFIQGYDDMKDYLLNSDLIKCQKCYAMNPNQTSASVADKLRADENQFHNQSCLTCLRLKEKIDSLQAPQEFIKVMDD